MRFAYEKLENVLNLFEVNKSAFAKSIGITPQTLYNLIKGKNDPSFSLVCRMSYKLKVPIEYFIIYDPDDVKADILI